MRRLVRPWRAWWAPKLEIRMKAFRFLVTSMEVKQLEDVLDRVSSCIGREFEAIEASPDCDFETSDSLLIAWMELTSRAVAYELVAIVEHELMNLAQAPWVALGHAPQGEVFSDEWAASIAKTKEVSREKFDKVQKLISLRDGQSVTDLDGWKEHSKLRELVNSVKHRRGRREHKQTFGSVDWRSQNLVERDEIGEAQARQAIRDVQRLLVALDSATQGQPH